MLVDSFFMFLLVIYPGPKHSQGFWEKSNDKSLCVCVSVCVSNTQRGKCSPHLSFYEHSRCEPATILGLWPQDGR